MRVFLVTLIPFIVLSFVIFVLTGFLLQNVCLESWPAVRAAINALPFLVPPALYFWIDRFVTQSHIGSILVRTFLMLVAVAIPLAIVIPSTLNATQHGKQKETLTRMRTIVKAL